MDLWINGGSGEGGREVVKTTSNKDEGDDNFALLNASLCLMLRFALHFDSSLFTLRSSLNKCIIGTTNALSKVEVKRPPRITFAIGL